MGLFLNLFSSDGFMPHGHCYLWTPALLWMHVVSDLLIGLSYVAISTMLVYLVFRARREIPFQWMFLAFGTFIIACGGTHFMEIWTTWVPRYWESGVVKVVTAGASVLTALALPPLLPVAVGLLRSARVSEDRRMQLESANAELKDLYDRAREFDELKTQFFANVSHELRTPLALILGPAEKMLSDGPVSVSQMRNLETIRTNARTLLKNVNDLLDVSKLEAGKVGMSYTEADLAEIVRATAAHFGALAEERTIAYSVDAPESLPAQIDPEKVQRVLLNLLSNAFKFTPAGGSIRCTLESVEVDGNPSDPPGGSRAILLVADSGPGVSPEMREAVFERFRQGEGGSTRRFGGTGLGLAIAKDFVEMHGGGVRVGDAPEGGALFTVDLPCMAPAGSHVGPARSYSTEQMEETVEQSVQELKSSELPLENSDGDPNRALVLVAEDNPEMGRFIIQSLSPLYRVESARDGKAALEMAVRLRPDLILSDMMMPEMSGEQLVRQARQHPELADTPIVMLTARTDDTLRVRLLREGAQDYLTKPFSVEELRARVQNLVAIKRAREILRHELAGQHGDLVTLTREVGQRRRELQSALESMRMAWEQAERANEVKGDFLRLVSHELRTPLNALQLQLHALHRDGNGLTPKQVDRVERMTRSSSRLTDLIESLLEYSRIQSGGLSVSPEPLDLSRLCEEVLDEIRPQAEQKALTLTLNAVGDLPPLNSDVGRIRMALGNLVDNAVKFTEHGRVEIRLDRDGDLYRIAVVDTGIGIPPERQTAIFEPFEQSEMIRQKHTPGVGIGLALVKEIVSALGGTLELQSDEGAGCVFTVRLPSLPAASEGDGAQGDRA